jgi:hypothetical protein
MNSSKVMPVIFEEDTEFLSHDLYNEITYFREWHTKKFGDLNDKEKKTLNFNENFTRYESF